MCEFLFLYKHSTGINLDRHVAKETFEHLTMMIKNHIIVKNYLEMEAVVLGSAIRGWDDWFSYRVEGKIATDFSFLCVKKCL